VFSGSWILHVHDKSNETECKLPSSKTVCSRPWKLLSSLLNVFEVMLMTIDVIPSFNHLLYEGYSCVHYFSSTSIRNNRSSRSAGPWRKLPLTSPWIEISVRENVLPIRWVPSRRANSILDELNEHFCYHVVCNRFYGRFCYGWVLATNFSGSQSLRFLYQLKISYCA
jgi:hypothetical protein